MSARSEVCEAIPTWKTRAARRAAQRTCEKGDTRYLGEIKRQAKTKRRQADRRAIQEQR